jgi:hypothetical protein
MQAHSIAEPIDSALKPNDVSVWTSIVLAEDHRFWGTAALSG